MLPKTPQMITQDILGRLGIDPQKYAYAPSSNALNPLISYSPIDGEAIGQTLTTPTEQMEQHIRKAQEAFLCWRSVPAPERGELIRLFAEELRRHKQDLGQLVTLEMGKIFQEGLGEVQEMIDICDFAVGLSRQLYGLTMASERPGHRMMETWHPLGVVGLLTPFNFPVAVWAWNFALALVCGNSTLWKPSEHTPLTAIACQHLFEQALDTFMAQKKKDSYKALDGLSILVQGGRKISEKLVDHPLIRLVSATGSTEMGRQVGQQLANRFAKSILELGGNNAMIVTPTADLSLAERAILFSAVGTCGQRCTTLRRLFIHESIAANLISRITQLYAKIPIGDPLKSGTLCGPLINQHSYDQFCEAIKQARQEGGKVFGGTRVLEDTFPNAYYVQPALIIMPQQTPIVCQETFAPILYVMTYKTLEEAISLNNMVPQGLSSCIFTKDLQEAEYFLSAAGSDCGLVNVNIGPSGAEIGGAFGGEKETGGGRESGSDAWKAYMRRATNTINYSSELPLSQGIHFDL